MLKSLNVRLVGALGGVVLAQAALAGGNCCQANSGPGCTDAGCEKAICAIDPFCCDSEWDSICAGEAQDFCAVCDGEGCPAAGSCYESHGTAGCNNADCCAIVCEADPFCCQTSWDSLCVDDAFVVCGNCGGADAGSCYDADGTPGCEDASCCELVCVSDPFCCNTSWDSLCVAGAVELCGVCGASGNCYESHGTPGCSDEDCCGAVCAADPFCCDTAWDSLCAGAAFELCGNCGGADAGNCYEANGTPGCNQSDCCEMICAADPFCCNTSWDGICAGDAAVVCGNCGGSGAGNCCVENGTPGCNNAECCETICAADPFCCNTEWDGICADSAQDVCNVCDSGACCQGLSCSITTPLGCAFVQGSYKGDGTACGPLTCNVIVLTGACCFDNGSCSQLSSANCNSQGGDFQGVFTFCGSVNCGPCDGDVDGDGDTDSVDLNVILANFGCVGPACPGDLNNSNSTNSVDLNIVLGNFGCGT